VFNATLSSLLGIVITPLWISLVASTGDAGTSIGGTIAKLCLWLLLPLVVGQILRPWWGAWVARHKRFVNTVDRLTILLLVYTSFCDSFVLGVWTRQGLQAVLLSLLLTGMLFWIVFSLMVLLSRLARFAPADRTAVIFCGSKKSLATGVPMAQLMFNGNPALGVILLPIMIYHPLQLVICGFLAGRWGREAGHATDSLPELIFRSEPAAMEESVSDSPPAPREDR
jgi:sodium/bile acid cotransporter 7